MRIDGKIYEWLVERFQSQDSSSGDEDYLYHGRTRLKNIDEFMIDWERGQSSADLKASMAKRINSKNMRRPVTGNFAPDVVDEMLVSEELNGTD